jgi:molybdopterin synthase catalytic subunit
MGAGCDPLPVKKKGIVTMNNITVLFFATLRDRAGLRSVHMQIPSHTTVASLRGMLDEKYFSSSGLPNHSLVAVNQEYVFDEFEIPGGAEVALFPAVSGG